MKNFLPLTLLTMVTAHVPLSTLVNNVPLKELLKDKRFSIMKIDNPKRQKRHTPMLWHPTEDAKRIFHEYDNTELSDFDVMLKWAEESDPYNVMICETTNRRCRSKTGGCETDWYLPSHNARAARHDFFGLDTNGHIIPLPQLIDVIVQTASTSDVIR